MRAGTLASGDIGTYGLLVYGMAVLVGCDEGAEGPRARFSATSEGTALADPRSPPAGLPAFPDGSRMPAERHYPNAAESTQDQPTAAVHQ